MKQTLKSIVKKLSENGLKVSTMESCTGGGIANAITNVTGASEVFNYGAVTYSNDFKIKMGVDSKIIDKYSVYSMETAREMSKKIAIFADSDFGIGVTGKLKKSDPGNIDGEDDIVFVCVYSTQKNKFYEDKLRVVYDLRVKNKKQVILKAIDLLEVAIDDH